MSAKIIYNNKTVAEVDYGDAASIPCKDKQMASNLTIVNNKLLQTKTVTPTETVQEITADEGKDGLSEVIVYPIPSEYIIPSGDLEITENGTHDVTDKASVTVAVEDKATPIEVSTEAEMTALLTSGEVGGVYKYTGETTDTYENGALYVLEEVTE